MSSITTAVAADYRLQQWVQLVKECQNRPSDMTVEQWCDVVFSIPLARHSLTIAVHCSQRALCVILSIT